MQTLKSGEIALLPFFTGTAHLLVVGQGATVTLEKSVDAKSSFYPLTDAGGNVVELHSNLNSDVIFNAELTNENQRVHYRLSCSSGEVQWECAK
jgi:hypothetical protein